MTEELLARSTRAYRDETSLESHDGDALLERIERSRRARLGTGRRVVRLTAFTLAAALVGSGAWAAATGRISQFVAWVVEAPAASPSLSRATVETQPARVAAPARPSIPVEPPPSSSSPASALAGPEHPGDAEAPISPHTMANRSVGTTVQAPVTAALPAVHATPPDVDALYREAHEAHFKTHDYAAALAAWDVYLAAAGPGSRMLIEARYNRGMALAHLGRGDAAIEALEPFAKGEYGEYRREDARRVIEKLER
jgi:hypothetical protein